MKQASLDGRCLCGNVTVSLRIAKATPGACHCVHCQRQTGSAFSTIVIAPIGDVVVAGELRSYEDVSEKGAQVSRKFCGTCGTPVLTESADLAAAGLCVVKAGILEGGALPPLIEVFCKRRLPWMPELHGSRRFDAMPSG